jgi:hypothetical protein
MASIARTLMRRRRMVMNGLGLSKTVPTALRPSLVIQRRAIQNGLLGKSPFWRVIALGLLIRGPVEGTFGKKPERLARFAVGPGHSVRVTTIRPKTRKQLKELGTTRRKLRATVHEQAAAEIQDPRFRP